MAATSKVAEVPVRLGSLRIDNPTDESRRLGPWVASHRLGIARFFGRIGYCNRILWASLPSSVGPRNLSASMLTTLGIRVERGRLPIDNRSLSRKYISLDAGVALNDTISLSLSHFHSLLSILPIFRRPQCKASSAASLCQYSRCSTLPLLFSWRLRPPPSWPRPSRTPPNPRPRPHSTATATRLSVITTSR